MNLAELVKSLIRQLWIGVLASVSECFYNNICSDEFLAKFGLVESRPSLPLLLHSP
jgi:hypothetical protein